MAAPPPRRGLVTAYNRTGRRYALTDLKKWLLLNKDLAKVEKVDFYVEPADWPHVAPLLDHARHLGVSLALATHVDAPPPAELDAWFAAGLHDVMLIGTGNQAEALAAWTGAIAPREHMARALLAPPYTGPDVAPLADALAGCRVVHLTPYGPFTQLAVRVARADTPGTLAQVQALADALGAREVEVNLLHWPYCAVDATRWPRVANLQQHVLDPHGYHTSAHSLAEQFYKLSPANMRKVVEIYNARGTSFHNLIDAAALPWIINKPYFFFWIWFAHRMLRHLNLLRQRLSRQPESGAPELTRVQSLRLHEQRTASPTCRRCALCAICSHRPEPVRQALPGLGLTAQPGAPVYEPLHYRREAPRNLEPDDAARARFSERALALAERARHLMAVQAPDREIDAASYAIEEHMTHHMPGSVRWYSFANAELQSTPLCTIEPPFTIAYTVGGGYAEQIGFSFGRMARIVCPMVAAQHRVALHVDAEGAHVLLRDGELVHPSETTDFPLAPPRLAGRLEPRLSIWNIAGEVVTQAVRVWEGEAVRPPAQPVRYSVLVVSTRYARRLQAVLQGIAHQQGVPADCFEVLVAYVPGIDATDDLLDSVQAAHPALRLLRMPFPEDHHKHKGFMINEAAAAASGEWVVLLDADIVLPPNFFARLDGEADGAVYLAPDGRKMCTPETTAKILLGEVRPWDDDEALLAAPGEYRHQESDGYPPGFCQVVRRDVLAAQPYAELRHFEGSDWLFSKRVIDAHGKEKRLEGMRVLHLDHGGSQWYGTEKHL